MTQRERKLLFGAGGATLLVVGLLGFNSLFLTPLAKRNQEIVDLNQELDGKKLALQQGIADRRELNRLRGLSLPADPNPLHRDYDLAWGEYDRFLRDLTRASGLKSVRITFSPPTGGPVNARNKKPLYQALTYSVEATGELTSVVAMLERFNQAPLLHQIKSLTIRPVKADTGSRARRVDSSARDTDVRMTVEALLVDGAQKRSYLIPGEHRLLAINGLGLAALQHGPSGLPVVPWALWPRPLIEATVPGDYPYIASNNIFYPPPAAKDPAKKRQPPKVEAARFLVLTDIIRRSDGKVRASLYDQLKGGRPITLDPADENASSLPVCKDTEDERLVRGEVIHIGSTEVVFRLKLVCRKEKEEDNGEKIICLDESKRLYRMKKDYWEALEEEETLTSTSGSAEGSNFLLREKIIGGTVVQEDAQFVVFEIYPKYFERLFAIHVAESLASALAEPLTSKEIKTLGIETVKSARK
jgi:hypothetical protein